MPNHSIAEIARALGAAAFGDTALRVTHVAEPADASPDALALAMKPEFAAGLAQGKARAALLHDGADWAALGLEAAIVPARPRYAMASLTPMMDPGQGFGAGIHPSAVIDPAAVLGQDVNVGPLCVIAAGARIGDGCTLGPGCHIGWNAELGAGSLLREHVSLGARVRVGARAILGPGTKLGSDGFSFVTAEPSGVEKVRASLGTENATEGQPWARIHSLGSVRLGDDVELGGNCVIDNGTVRDTVIGDGCKLDNLVHIAHNVVIGRDCLFAGQVGIAGSTVIGDNVTCGGQVGIGDNLRIGDRVVLGGGTGVLTSVPAGRVMLGYPAMQMDKQIDSYKALRRLPRLLASLQKAGAKPPASD
ncbi:MAG: UDP-3-O-(3-hydroxymyristoyl)glucosamine N-acyltransferase [Pseudomonadota bacterium]